MISANNLRKKMTNKFEIAKEVILRRLDKAGTYRPIDEDVARRIVCSVLDAFINTDDRKEDGPYVA